MASRTRELQGSPCRGRLRWPGVWPSCSYLPCWRRVPCRRRRGAPSQPSSRSSQPSRFRSWLPPWSPSAIPYHSLWSPSPSSSSSSVAALVLRMLHVVKNVLFFFRFTQQRDIIMRPNFHPLKTRTLHSRKNGSRSIAFLFFFLISILMSCLAADLAKRFFENGPRNSIDDDDTRVADVDKERVRLGGGEGAGREGPRMQRTNFRPRSDEVKQYRTWVTQKGVGAFVHSPREGRGAHFFSSKYKIR